MSNYNTRNPVPSIDPRDLDDNATNFDLLLMSPDLTVPDRLGVQRKSWAGVEADAEALVSPNVAALAGLTGQADRVPYFTGAGALSLAVITTVARTLLAASTQAAQRTALGLGSVSTLAAGAANGAATLGADGKLPVSQLPPLAVNETFTVANQAAMLALTAERGDVAIRSDLSGAAYLLTADAPATLANWIPIQQDLGIALTALRALTPAADKLPYFTGTGTAALADFPAIARNLLAATTQAAQRAVSGSAAVTDKPAWSAYTPTITATTGAYTTVSSTGTYAVILGICHFQATLTITTKGTGVTPIFSLPVAASASSAGQPLPIREAAINGKSGMAAIRGDLTTASTADYANGDLVTGNGAVITIQGSYPVA